MSLDLHVERVEIWFGCQDELNAVDEVWLFGAWSGLSMHASLRSVACGTLPHAQVSYLATYACSCRPILHDLH